MERDINPDKRTLNPRDSKPYTIMRRLVIAESPDDEITYTLGGALMQPTYQNDKVVFFVKQDPVTGVVTFQSKKF